MTLRLHFTLDAQVADPRAAAADPTARAYQVAVEVAVAPHLAKPAALGRVRAAIALLETALAGTGAPHSGHGEQERLTAWIHRFIRARIPHALCGTVAVTTHRRGAADVRFPAAPPGDARTALAT